jgi:Domain of unknown function (DUF4397)
MPSEDRVMIFARLRTRRLAGNLCVVCALSLAAAVLTGCTSVAGSSPVTLVRVIDASSNAPALDAYVSTIPIALNFVGPSVSNYAFLGPGARTVRIDDHGTNTVAADLTGTFSASQQHTVYVTDLGASFTANLLTDQSAPAPDGDVSFRFLQQANATGAVDVYVIPDGTAIKDAKPLFAALAPGVVTPYINIPAGTYDIVIAAAGTTTGAYTSAATAFTAGQVRTLLIVDQRLVSTPPVNVIVANDVN